jgi:hypothetical protein
MRSRIDKFESLSKTLDEACKLAQQLGLDHLPFLLEMAKLELFKEVEAALNGPSAQQPHRAHSSSRRSVN